MRPLLVLKEISLLSWTAGWALCFSLIFGTIAFFLAPNNLRAIAKEVEGALALATLFGAGFGVTCWGVVRLVPVG